MREFEIQADGIAIRFKVDRVATDSDINYRSDNYQFQDESGEIIVEMSIGWQCPLVGPMRKAVAIFVEEDD